MAAILEINFQLKKLNNMTGDSTKFIYLKYLGDKTQEIHQIRVDNGAHSSDAIVYYKNDLYSFARLCGPEDIISNEIFGVIKNKLNLLRKDVFGEKIIPHTGVKI